MGAAIAATHSASVNYANNHVNGAQPIGRRGSHERISILSSELALDSIAL